jgi:hypothetical protein
MNTPSHHRVHHGVNPRYQDRNYAGVLIVWDRLFGSFTPEREEPVYGITKPLETWNPLWANLHVFAEIFRNAGRARSWRDRLKIVFGPPGWMPDYLGGPVKIPDVSTSTFRKYDPFVPVPSRRYAVVQFALVVLAAMAVLRFASALSWFQVGVLVFYLTVTLSNLGSLLEGRPWVYSVELARLLTLVAVAGALLALGRFTPSVLLAIGTFGLASLAWFVRLRPLVRPALQPA